MPTLRSNKIAESAEFLGMLSEVELKEASYLFVIVFFASSHLSTRKVCKYMQQSGV